MTAIATIPANDRRESFVASAGQTVFPFDFPVYAAADLQVLRVRAGTEAVLTLAVDYTVTGAGLQAGGSITLTAGALAADQITILSAQPASRISAYSPAGDLRADALNADVNRLWIYLQQLATEQPRVLRLAASDLQADLILPPTAERANRYLACDQAGNVIGAAGTAGPPTSPFMATLLDAANAKAARARLAAAYATAFDIRDYGAVANTSGAAAACLAAIAALPTEGGAVIIPTGTWLWEQEVIISRNRVSIVCAPGAVIRRTTANHIFRLSGNENSILGGIFDGNVASVTTRCSVLLVQGDFNVLNQVRAQDSSDHGINLDGQTTTCQGNRVLFATVRNTKGVGIAQNNARDTTIFSPDIDGTDLEGLTVDVASYRNEIIGGRLANTCRVGGVGGVGIDQCDFLEISGVYVDTVGASLPAITFQNEVGPSNYNTISGCRLVNSTIGIHFKNNIGGACAHNHVTGCIFRDNGGTSIRLDAGTAHNRINTNALDFQPIVDLGDNNSAPPGEVRFYARQSSAILNVTGDGTAYQMPYAAEQFDNGWNCYNPSTGLFTAPVAGWYALFAGIRMEGGSAHTFGAIDIVTSRGTFTNIQNIPAGSAAFNVTAAASVFLRRNETAYVAVRGGGGGAGKILDISADANANFFSGSLLG